MASPVLPLPTSRPLPPRDRVRVATLSWLGHGIVRLLGATLRVTEVNREPVEALWAQGSPVIYAVWHGRMLMLPYLYRGRRQVHVLASRSRDGELVSRLANGFGFRVVRGSSSRGAATALRALGRLLREEHGEVAVVPDGPRGPRHVAQPGAVMLAMLGRAPIVPVGFGVSRGTLLSSWDRFLIPHPFARAVIAFGDPLVVPGDADRDTLERARAALETALTRATLEADRVAGAHRVPAL